MNTKDRVVEFLQEKYPAAYTKNDIVKRLGLANANAVTLALNRLMLSGIVTRTFNRGTAYFAENRNRRLDETPARNFKLVDPGNVNVSMARAVAIVRELADEESKVIAHCIATGGRHSDLGVISDCSVTRSALLKVAAAAEEKGGGAE